MTFSQVCHFVSTELSAGGALQNVAFYVLLLLLSSIWIMQLKEKQSRLRTN